MPKLIVLKGADAGKQFDLTDVAVTIGRHSGNAVPLHDDKISRRHLEIRPSSTGFQLVDLGSGNGTLVNGRAVKLVDLRSGDQIAAGDTVLVFAADAPSASGSSVKAPAPAPTLTPLPKAEPATLSNRPVGDLPSAILRTIADDEGSRILTRPHDAVTDWLRTRLASLTVLYEATEAVSAILDVDELLLRVVELVVRNTEADHGCAVLIDPESHDLMPKAVHSRLGLPGAEFVVSRTVVEYVLTNRQGILVADAGTDERFRRGESVARHRLREVICVPMKGRHETVGVLFLDTSGTADGSGNAVKFTEDHLRLAVAVAHQAALAVEETRYYQALVQAERLAAVGQTIAALSHHIKNIMQGVRFGSDMVRMGLTGDDRELLQKGWRLVEKNQTKIDELILDMLSYSKDREPAIEPTDLNALADDVLDVVRGRAAEREVALEWTPGPGVTAVPCDPDGIHRALLNIVSNALDAVDAAESNVKRIQVQSRLSDDAVFAELIVTDTGGGIPLERLDDIFKPFVSTKGARGTGLGLPVSRKILREHGGDVLLTSIPGEGSQFTLRIPLQSMRAAFDPSLNPATTSRPVPSSVPGSVG